jgi:hypothetical protein
VEQREEEAQLGIALGGVQPERVPHAPLFVVHREEVVNHRTVPSAGNGDQARGAIGVRQVIADHREHLPRHRQIAPL